MLEQIVRPFQTPTTIADKRIVVTTVVKATPQKAILIWGSVGQAPETFSIGLKVANTDNNYKEKSRKTTDVRIQNPDDPSQYIITQRMDQVTFTKKANTDATSGNSSGTSGGMIDNTAFASPPTTNTLTNPVATSAGPASAASPADETHNFTLDQPTA